MTVNSPLSPNIPAIRKFGTPSTELWVTDTPVDTSFHVKFASVSADKWWCDQKCW